MGYCGKELSVFCPLCVLRPPLHIEHIVNEFNVFGSIIIIGLNLTGRLKGYWNKI